jgi:UDP-glucose 4-epimerase
MKILVTGGCGFIGSHLVDELVNRQHDVIVIDDCSANNEKFYFNDKATYYKVSITDEVQVNQISDGCDYIFHLGAESRLQNSIDNPTRAVEVNVLGTLNILKACKQNNINGLIFSSTSCVYGLTDNLPITENHAENCLNPYGSTKYAAELLIKNYFTLFNVKSCILRYFNVFGERAPAQGPYALVTSIFFRRKAAGQPLTVVGDGLQERDFICVKDVVAANIACMENWHKKEICSANVFNVSSHTSTSILQLAKTISENITHIPERLGEAKSNLASSKKLKSVTGWQSTVDILEWIKKSI